MRDQSLFIPEGYSSDHKADLENFSKTQRTRYNPLDNIDPMSSYMA